MRDKPTPESNVYPDAIHILRAKPITDSADMIMKTRFFPFLLLLLFASATATAQVNQEGIAEEDRTSALVYEFDADFDVVFDAVQKGLVEAGYEVQYKSKRRKLVESQFRILAGEDDDFFDIMEQYGEVPYVRSPKWVNGRAMVSIRFEENATGTVAITVTAELSAFESRFVNNWIYWTSNGLIEEEVLTAIISAVEASTEGSDL